jgi:flagellar motor switch protein FliN/FliY
MAEESGSPAPPAGDPPSATSPTDPVAAQSAAGAAPVESTPDAADPLAEGSIEDAVAPSSAAEAAVAAPAEPDMTDMGMIDQAAIDELLKQANFEDPSAIPGGTTALPETTNFDLPNFQQVLQDAQVSSIDLLRDVELNVKIELGRSRMLVEDVLKLGEGSVVELDKLAGDPVDVFVNDRLVARGEVLVLNDNFCVRVNEIVAAAKDDMV